VRTSMVTFWESEEAIRAFAGDDISLAKYYDFDKDFLIEMEPCSMHYEMYDRLCFWSSSFTLPCCQSAIDGRLA